MGFDLSKRYKRKNFKIPALTGIDKGIELGNGSGVKKDGGMSHVRDLHVLPDLTVVAILHALFEGRPGVHLYG
ncbi:MAG: hypothetical protein EBX50_16360 [Chitinophagia bacterium]|nr:hypothetical protein [Chitinophagia bacterium]